MKINDLTKNGIDAQISIYDTYRKYIIHQDNVVNYRMTWLLSIHGFLYATYGFTLQKKFEIIEKISNIKAKDNHVNRFLNESVSSALGRDSIRLFWSSYDQVNHFLETIIGVGSFVSFIALALIFASTESTKNIVLVGNSSFSSMARKDIIKSRFTGDITQFQIHNNFYIPGLVGGGSSRIPSMGRLFQYLIPVTLITSWLVSFYFLLYSI